MTMTVPTPGARNSDGRHGGRTIVRRDRLSGLDSHVCHGHRGTLCRPLKRDGEP